MPRQTENTKQKNGPYQEAKKALRDAGLSQQAAAEDLGVTFWHLNRVLNNKRHSVSLCLRVLELAEKKAVAK
jgi:hypothetical protein